MSERLFLDTAFVQALLNHRDQFHTVALSLATRMRAADVSTTDAVLVEIGNARSSANRAGAVRFIEQAYQTPNLHVVHVDQAVLTRAVQLWGMTDCISFVAMSDDHSATHSPRTRTSSKLASIS